MQQTTKHGDEKWNLSENGTWLWIGKEFPRLLWQIPSFRSVQGLFFSTLFPPDVQKWCEITEWCLWLIKGNWIEWKLFLQGYSLSICLMTNTREILWYSEGSHGEELIHASVKSKCQIALCYSHKTKVYYIYCSLIIVFFQMMKRIVWKQNVSAVRDTKRHAREREKASK